MTPSASGWTIFHSATELVFELLEEELMMAHLFGLIKVCFQSQSVYLPQRSSPSNLWSGCSHWWCCLRGGRLAPPPPGSTSWTRVPCAPAAANSHPSHRRPNPSHWWPDVPGSRKHEQLYRWLQKHAHSPIYWKTSLRENVVHVRFCTQQPGYNEWLYNQKVILQQTRDFWRNSGLQRLFAEVSYKDDYKYCSPCCN